MQRGALPVIGSKVKKQPKTNVSSAGAGDSAELRQHSGNVCLVTLGCAKNEVDSEVMLGEFLRLGYAPILDPAQAEIIVVNTCAFLRSAVEESVERIVELAQWKKNGRLQRLIVAGCIVERYREDLRKALPEVDQFISTDDLLLAARSSSTGEDCFDPQRKPHFLYDHRMYRARGAGEPSAYVKIAEGCDRPCAFCIIPKLRGSYRSRDAGSVMCEVRELLARGVREINLVAQDLTAFGADLPRTRRTGLAELLRQLADQQTVNARFWLRLLYGFPSGISDDLLSAINDLPYVCKYLDLPLQHISDAVLQRMRRPLGEKQTRKLIERILERVPGIALRTTFLVGFPGETEEDVKILEDYVRQGLFAHAGVFAYSPEPEAPAHNLPDQIPEAAGSERRGRIMECQQAVVARRLAHYPGTRVEVLIEGAHSETDLLLAGRCAWQAPETDGEVIINEVDEPLLAGAEHLPEDCFRGQFGIVEITAAAGYDLVGRLLSVSQNQAGKV